MHELRLSGELIYDEAMDVRSVMLMCLLTAACGPQQPRKDTSKLSAEARDLRAKIAGALDVTGTSGPEQPWETMGADEREFYMIGKYHPVMRSVFLDWTDERYGLDEHLECTHCHGEDMREQRFKMPSKAIFQLPQPGTDAWVQMEDTYPDAVAFMRERVTHVSSSLLGKPEHGCNSCHTLAGSAHTKLTE